MKPSTRWFGWIALITVLHMTEQLVFGLGEPAEFETHDWCVGQVVSEHRYGHRCARHRRCGTSLSRDLSILRGGRAKFVALVALNMAALGEVHHLIESAYAGRYTPGTVTAIPYIIFGILLQALIYERRTEKAVGAQVGAQAAVSAA